MFWRNALKPVWLARIFSGVLIFCASSPSLTTSCDRYREPVPPPRPRKGRVEYVDNVILTRNLSIVTAAFISLPVWAQPAAGPEFEAASIKPNSSPGGISVLIPANAKLLARRVTLMRLISFAYDLSFPRISGPSWLDSATFDIQAKGQVGSKDADIRLMTQKLLTDRFGLQCHRETKVGNVYLLIPAGGESKMAPEDEPQPPRPKFPPRPHNTAGGDATMGELAALLSKVVGVPVIDRTAIAGKFHYYLWWGRNPDLDPDIFQAVKEQLGLKLQSGKSDVEFLVIDRVSRTPSEN
jgi:uncharacterized protein (TIGR03435 family)